MKSSLSATNSELSEGRTKTSRDSSASVVSEKSDELSRLSVVQALAPRARKVNDLSSFTIDKLKYDSLGLHGRDKELKLLEDVMSNMISGKSPEQERQLILISGVSGTGKTALAHHALRKSTESLGGLYARGKFDLHLRNHPYSGISAACSEICGAIVALESRNPSQFERLCSQITSELGSELALLIQVIPVLAEIVTIIEFPLTENSSSIDSKNQINFAFLRFIRAVSYQFMPLVFVLDDLQWADGASIDLLEALLSDATGTSKLLVVGIYRSNEVDETHIFHQTIKDLKEKSKEKYFEMNELEIGNLDLDAVHTIIQGLLGMDGSDASKTWGLADVCHRKTLGNVFYLLQFMAMLKERQMLQFNFGIVSWTWDEKEIETSTKSSDNVVDLLKSKMAELSAELVKLLPLASSLGSTFKMCTLELVWNGSKMKPTISDNHDTLMARVAKLESLGFIAKVESNSAHDQNYRWTHDKVQEAALSLVPETKQGEFAAQVGHILLSHLEEEELDSSIFMVVNLLNGNSEGAMDRESDSRLDLSRLNWKASQKAILCSAFDCAAEYAAKGIQFLPENAWVDHYEVALNLHTVGARAEGILGNTETMERYCKQVISQDDRPIEDKFGVYNTWIDSLLNRVLLDEARDLGLEILEKLKCRLRKNPVVVVLSIFTSVIGVKATMKSRDVSKLSLMNDTQKVERNRILDKIGTVFYMAKDIRFPLVVFRSLNLTMKDGCNEYSSVAFAGVGVILTGALNDLTGTVQFPNHGCSNHVPCLWGHLCLYQAPQKPTETNTTGV
jgi:predicted ATPase